MYNKRKRDTQYIHNLKEFIEKSYNMPITSIEPSERGFYGETWKITCADKAYFVKLSYQSQHKNKYKETLNITKYFNDIGIDFVHKIILTNDNALYSVFNEGILCIFEFLQGVNVEDYDVSKLFDKLAMIYKLPVDLIEIEIEDFSLYVLEEYHNHVGNLKNINNTQVKIRLINQFESMTDIIKIIEKRLFSLSAKCKMNLESMYITHGDAGGNCLVSDDAFYIIDWDYPKIAPIERDAWFFIGNRDNMMKIQKSILNLNYELDKDRLSYYCYYSFFSYLVEYFDMLTGLSDITECEHIINDIFKYLTTGWIWEQIGIVDKLI